MGFLDYGNSNPVSFLTLAHVESPLRFWLQGPRRPGGPRAGPVRGTPVAGGCASSGRGLGLKSLGLPEASIKDWSLNHINLGALIGTLLTWRCLEPLGSLVC